MKPPAPAIILSAPQLGENIGAAARAMANFGLSDLRLVAPRDGWPNERATAMAAGAAPITEGARVFGSVREALGDLDFVLATTARDRGITKEVLTPEEAARRLRRAAAKGDPERYPAVRARRAAERHRLLVAVVDNGDGILLFRRPDDSTLLAGTWELPWVTLERDGEEAGGPPESGLAARYGGRWSLERRAARVRHGITFRDLEVDVHRARLAWGGEVRDGMAAGWFDETARAGLPMSSLVGKALGALTGSGERATKSRSRRR